MIRLIHESGLNYIVRMKEFSTLAVITADGKNIRVQNKYQLLDFYRENKGKRMELSMRILDPTSIDDTIRYIRGVLFPVMLEKFRELGNDFYKNEMELMLTDECPYCYRDSVLLRLEEMTKDLLVQFIRWCKQYAAENMDYAFQD